LDYDLFRVIARPMTHLPESVAYRVESNEGKSAVLSGDTDYCPDLVELARDADVLVIESALPDEMKAEGHLTPSLAGRIGREANCKKLVLTHLYPVCDSVDIVEQCKKEYGGELLIAEDLMEICI